MERFYSEQLKAGHKRITAFNVNGYIPTQSQFTSSQIRFQTSLPRPNAIWYQRYGQPIQLNVSKGDKLS